MSEKDQQNPFTIGNPFTIQLEDSEEDTPTAEMEDISSDVLEKNIAEDKKERESLANSPTPSTEMETEGEEEKEVETKEIEIEDILDKPVAFDDGQAQESKKKVDEALSTNDAFFDYQSAAEQLISTGFWEDFEGRDGLEIDKDTFEQLSKQQDEWKKQNIGSSIYNSLDPAEREYLDFKRMGGDLDTYYQSKTKVERVNNLDLDSEQGKLSAIYTYYKNFVGWNDDKINKYIGKLDSNDLEEEAGTAAAHVQAHVQKQHAQMMQQQQILAEKRNNAISNYKKNVRSVLKNQQVNDRQARQVVKSLTNIDPKTGFTAVDEAYLSFRNDPERSVLLYRFLSDPESFINEVSSDKQQEERKKLFFELKKKGKTNEKKDFSFKPTRDKQTRNPFTNK
tara:strand:+ start:13668 stop:14849 length:1182 start_codon:yes stop_codon:yes gene_type:complete